MAVDPRHPLLPSGPCRRHLRWLRRPLHLLRPLRRRFSGDKNIYVALHKLGIRQISVSTTFSFLGTITSTTRAGFQPNVHDLLVGNGNLLDFLVESNSAFLINLQVYDHYHLDFFIPPAFALFQEAPLNLRDVFIDEVLYRYWNLFDRKVDALVRAMVDAGHESIPIIITEIGWPVNSEFGLNHRTATKVFVEMFLRGLVKHLRSGIWTPLKRDGVSEVYIFELLAGEQIPSSNGDVLQWGIWYPNLTKKFNIDLGGPLSVRSHGLPKLQWLMVLLALGILLSFCKFTSHDSSCCLVADSICIVCSLVLSS